MSRYAFMTSICPPMQHELTNADFEAARQDFLDGNKPDPIVSTQVAEWIFEWKPDDRDANPENVGRLSLSGTLGWQGPYAIAVLAAQCTWSPDDDTSADVHGNGQLSFTCQAHLELVPDQQGESSSHATIHRKMVDRLRADDYVKALLRSASNRPADLCEASVAVTKSHDNSGLEERVSWNQDTCEGIRRALFTTADNAMDVLEFVTYLPLLPIAATPLANRARLRLLEDAMYDACEQEDEDEMVEQLRLEQSQRDNNDQRNSSQKKRAKTR